MINQQAKGGKTVKENDLREILAQELERINECVCGGGINLAEIERRTGIGRSVLRRWQRNGYELKPSRNGWRGGESKLNKVAGAVDGFLRKGVTNSSIIFDRIRELGYDGGISILKDCIRAHHGLVPAPRQSVEPIGNRRRRYTTERGDCYQMDWGFATTPSASHSQVRVTGAEAGQLFLCTNPIIRMGN